VCSIEPVFCPVGLWSSLVNALVGGAQPLDVQAPAQRQPAPGPQRESPASEVNSEIVLVATVATVASGRELRPEASVFDTITTWTF
jgi:hypothetical protein